MAKLRAVLLKATPEGSEVELDTKDIIINMARTGASYFILLGPEDVKPVHEVPEPPAPGKPGEAKSGDARDGDAPKKDDEDSDKE